MSLFERFKKLDDYLKRGLMNDYVKNTTFKAYLVKDNYTPQFFKDFDEYYSTAFLAAPDYYLTTSQKTGLNKLITDNRITVREPQTAGTALPYGGLYSVELNITLDNPNVPSFLSGPNGNARIEVVLRPLKKADNYNPLYEMPFDGDVGNKNGVFVRNGYGTAVTGSNFRLNDTLKGNPYTNAMTNITTQKNTNLQDLQNSKILTINKNGAIQMNY
ncbi:hypothetical protein MEO41_27515, partial [Dolichospermum sp. ST_sed4]|nr:hypothetical protein [Dolichospermum sp. ST_sed4]